MSTNNISSLAVHYSLQGSGYHLHFEGWTGSDDHGGGGRFHFTLDPLDTADLRSLITATCPYAEGGLLPTHGNIRWLDGLTANIQRLTMEWTDDTLHASVTFPKTVPSTPSHHLLALSRSEAEALRCAIDGWSSGIRPLSDAAACQASGLSQPQLQGPQGARAAETMAALRGVRLLPQRHPHRFTIH